MRLRCGDDVNKRNAYRNKKKEIKPIVSLSRRNNM